MSHPVSREVAEARVRDALAALKGSAARHVADATDFVRVLGLDSLATLRLLLAVEAGVGIEFDPFESFDEHLRSFGAFVDLVVVTAARQHAGAGEAA